MYDEYYEPCDICGDICEDCFEYGCCGYIEESYERTQREEDDFDTDAAIAISIINDWR